jgi:WD40 repeat protein
MLDEITQDSEPREAPLGERPYRGLGFYTEADADWFFGRDTERSLIIAHLRTARLTLLYAESGVGKSSVLRAGVTARLREAAVENLEEGESPEFIPVVFKDWKDDPVNNLVKAIEREAALWSDELANAKRRRPPPATLNSSGSELLDRINATADPLDATFLIILDQFEELFGYPAHQDRFADELAACINARDLRANFLISLREDAYGRIGDLLDTRIKSVYSNYLHLEYLSRDAAREAIEKPVDVYNAARKSADQVRLEPELTDAVLKAAGDESLSLNISGDERARLARRSLNGDRIEAPFLQLVMERVWDWEIDHGSHTLRKDTLENALGGAATIVSNHLDRALGRLSNDELDTATDVFSDLVAPSGTKIAYTAGDLAQRHEKHSDTAVADVLKKLDEQRIVRKTDPAPGASEDRYEIYHDRLAQPILTWARERKNARLAREKREAEEVARAFRRRTYIAATTAAALLVALIGVAVWLYVRDQQQQTRDQERTARALALGSDALQDLGSRPDVSLSLALAAYRLRPHNSALSMAASLQGFRRTGAIGILHGHADTVNTVAFSPDGRTVATGSSDRTIRLWNVATRRQIGQPLTGRGTTGVVQVVFSPDGQTLASAGGFDHTVRLWDVRAHAPIGQPIPADDNYAYGVAFSPDGQTLATAGHNHQIALWDVRTHNEIGPAFHCPCKPVTSVAFDPHAPILASAGYDGAVQLWSVRTHRLLARIDGLAGTIYAIAFGPDGRTLAYAGTYGTIRLLDIQHRVRQSRVLTGHSAAVTSLAFNARGQLASVSADSTVRLWDLRTFREVGTPLTHAGAVLGVAFSPDGATVASAGLDGTVRLWDASSQARLGERLRGQGGPVYSVAESRDGKTFAAGNVDGEITLWRGQSHAERARPLISRGGPIRSLAFSPDGSTLAASAKDGNVRLWDVNTGKQAEALRGDKTPVNAVSFSPDGRTLATGELNGRVTLWDVRNDVAVKHLSARQATLHSVAFSPDGKLLVTAGDATIRIWNPRTGQPLVTLTGSGAPIDATAFSPDGHTLVSAGDDKSLRLWDVRTGAELGTLTGSTGAIYGVAFSPDGRTLASGGADNSVRLWDTQTMDELGPPLGDHQNAVYGVAFSPDGHTLISGGGDGAVRVWSGIFWRNLRDLESQACSLIGTGLSRAEWYRYARGIPYLPSC